MSVDSVQDTNSLHGRSEQLAKDLWEAVRKEEVEKVTSLLKEGAKPDHELFWSRKWSQIHDHHIPSLHLACTIGNLEIVKALVDCGASVTKIDIRDKSPLYRACLNWHLDLVKYLLTLLGQSQDTSDTSLLYAACRAQSLDIVKHIIEVFNCNPLETEKNTVVYHSSMEYALAYDPNFENAQKKCDIARYMILDRGFGGEVEKVQLLCLACYIGKLDLVKELVENHNINPEDQIRAQSVHFCHKPETSPLKCALNPPSHWIGLCTHENGEVTLNYPSFDVLFYLIRRGHGSDENKARLLYRACLVQRVDEVEKLVKEDILHPCAKVSAEPKEVYFSSSYWDLDRNEIQSVSGQGVCIAILDNGINPHHVAFRNTRIYGKNFTSEEGGSNKECVYFDLSENSHGTAVASIIAGGHIPPPPDVLKKYKPITSGSVNLPLGVASKASLVICRVGHSSAEPQCVIKALDWIYEHNASVENKLEHAECPLNHDDKLKDKICIVSMSFRLGENILELEGDINKLKTQNVLCIAGAGNDGRNERPGYPARYPNTLSVGAVNSFGRQTDFSVDDSSVDVYALGQDVLLATNSVTTRQARSSNLITLDSVAVPPPPPPGGPPPLPPKEIREAPIQHDKTFRCDSGTSFAAPAVAGLVAILVQHVRKQAPGLAHHLTNIDFLREVFKKHLQEGKLLQCDKVRQFFAYNIKHIEHVIRDILAK